MDTTVSQSEVNHFNQLASEWWHDNGKYKVLHAINPIRIKYILDSIKSHFGIIDGDLLIKGQKEVRSLSVLDVGCGGGLISLPLAKLQADVTGIDASSLNIESASQYAKKYQLSNLKYINDSIENLLATEVKYDVIIAFEVLEHVVNLELFISSCVKLLAPNGLMLFSTINRNLKSYMLAILMAENLFNLVPKGTHYYNKLLKPSEISVILEKYGYNIYNMQGIEYSLIKREWVISDNISVNYMMKIYGA